VAYLIIHLSFTRFSYNFIVKQQIKSVVIGVTFAAAIFVPLIGLAAGPYLQLSSSQGAPGSTLVVSGYQFGPSTNVLVSLAGTTTGAAISNGSFTTTLTVPNVSPGTYTVLATSPQREQASASFTVTTNQTQRYYPHAEPSSWYLRPGQQLSFSGSGFAPNTSVTIQGGDGVIQTTTDNSGTFTISPFTIPYAWQNSRQKFNLSSEGSAYPVVMTIGIGTFYPHLTPSSYYIGTNQSMTATVSGFAPGEPVMLLSNGSLIAQANADSAGRTSFIFTTPSSRGRVVLKAQGAYSSVSVSRTITVHQ
jgi:hypothetical protein